ncbi:hypothetical protein GLAREA_03280 [Glarea lozoyensis ATCC 20868]|uniref:Uncharacterized protein n=1 Tax=Glarea lozoyensis (strain ATCC 20868 / MF5171) TaxID=1116229 RepID=S3CNR9_GLAL2|nr:uncharacterized protein GLAREA_03280 [Glarea lozoyensis ATCC 20868]EPE27365.1 hypothetical protein GLAREA_03280 [Glarea lozoyensis ATCC 20868]
MASCALPTDEEISGTFSARPSGDHTGGHWTMEFTAWKPSKLAEEDTFDSSEHVAVYRLGNGVSFLSQAAARKNAEEKRMDQSTLMDGAEQNSCSGSEFRTNDAVRPAFAASPTDSSSLHTVEVIFFGVYR